jgi:type VI secretion system secreted protein VgrG
MTTFRINPFDRPEIVKSTADYGTSVTVKVVVEGQMMKHDIISIELFQFVDDHHMLKIKLRETGQVADGKDIEAAIPYTSFLGKSISLTVTPEGGVVGAARELGFVGLVTHVSIENSIDQINAGTIIAHSPTVTMDGAKHNAFFREQSASDIIGSILRKYPITLGTIDSSSGSLKFSVQHRETDYEYVMRLASGAGLFALYDGKEFRVVKPAAADVEELVWRETLGAFVLGMGTEAAEFSSEVYNYEQKKTYTQDSKSLPLESSLSDLTKVAPDASKKVYGDSGFTQEAKIIEDAQSLDAVLKRERSRALGRMMHCTGRSIVPAVVSGHSVKIKGMQKMDGTYWVSSVKHVIEAGRYHNVFDCLPLDLAFPQLKSARPSLSNLQMAVVVDNNDPEKLGRIKVKFPWNESDETPWVRVMSMHAGKDRGWYCLPEIADEVLVGYEQGSPDLPVVLGSLYNSEDTPHSEVGDDANSIKAFMTRSGNKIVIDDTDGSELISIVSKDGSKIIMNAGGPSITVESGGDITIKGKNIKIESDEELSLKSGTDFKEEAGAGMKAKASAACDIEGATVTVKGNPINLN